MADPDYIQYLLNPKLKYDCYFIVGNPALSTRVETIGVVKKMLLAHSVVLRTELQESKMAEEDNVAVTDIYPDTFRHMLRYVYGYDNTAVLSFDDADNLLYAAEKYMLCSLKDKLTRRLMNMLDYTNICSLMNNPACFRALELNFQITKILQYETDKVLASPQFPGLSPDAFLRILQQDALSVPEIEVWRAAIKWAKNRADSEEGPALRKELTRHVQHIRVCTLTTEDLRGDVLHTNVLSNDEFKCVCLSVTRHEKQENLTTVCNEVEERPKAVVKSEPIVFPIAGLWNNTENSTINLLTKEFDIELMSMVFASGGTSAHQCNLTINIQKHHEAPVAICFNDLVIAYSDFTVPISINGQNVHLLANSLYKITFTVCASEVHTFYWYNYGILTNEIRRQKSEIRNDHFSVYFDKWNHHVSHTFKIVYRIVKKKALFQTQETMN